MYPSIILLWNKGKNHTLATQLPENAITKHKKTLGNEFKTIFTRVSCLGSARAYYSQKQVK